MNGHMYGWVDKEHCILLKPLPCDYKLITLNNTLALIPVEEEQ